VLSEALVIFACINSTGCSETSSHYYNTHPEIKEIVQKHEKLAEKYIGPVVIQTVGPVLCVASGGTGTIRLSRNWSLQLGRDRGTLAYRLEW